MADVMYIHIQSIMYEREILASLGIRPEHLGIRPLNQGMSGERPAMRTVNKYMQNGSN